MGRGKLKLEFITNEKTRKTTFLKRKKGMIKKANDFSILCGIDVCLFISAPKLDGDDDNNSRPTEFETWPPERSKVMNIINKYQASISRKPPKKVYGLKDAFVDRKKKIEAEISRCRKKLSEAKYPTSLDLIEHFSLDEMSELVHRLDGKIEAIQFVIEAKKEHDELNKEKNQALSLISSSNNYNNNQLQELLDQMPRQYYSADYSSCPIKLENSTVTGSNNHMKYSTMTTNLRGPVFNDPMAGIQQMGSFGFDNATAAEIQRMAVASYSGFPNYMQYSGTARSGMQGTVFGSPTAGMLPDNMNSDWEMTTYGGSSSGGGGGCESSSVQVQAQNYPPLQVQPPSVPYMQYPMNVINLARRIGPM